MLKYKNSVLSALKQELAMQQQFPGGAALETIYFGGGTPSLLDVDEIESLLDIITNCFKIRKDAEITLEANPDDLDAEKLTALRRMGINRLSIGIQSFNDLRLKYLNRIHSGSEAIKVVESARQAGFDNLNCDLIYGIPAADHKTWLKDLELMTSLNPEHISAYCLTIEPNTYFGRKQEKNELPVVTDEFAASEYEMAMEHLAARGYLHYEISNFATREKLSRHNTSYWQGKIYLGVGPGAHSYDGNYRYYNIANNARYVKSIGEGKIPAETEKLSSKQQINEYLMTSIRTVWGCDLNILKTRYDFDFLAQNDKQMRNLQQAGFILFENNTIRLTNQGKLVADQIILDFFLDD